MIPVVGEKWGVAPSLRLLEDIYLSVESLVSLNRVNGANDLSSAHVISLYSSEQTANIVSSLSVIHTFLEHFNTYGKTRHEQRHT